MKAGLLSSGGPQSGHLFLFLHFFVRGHVRRHATKLVRFCDILDTGHPAISLFCQMGLTAEYPATLKL